MKTAAIFGGSFDPIHIGHLEIVKKLKELDFIDDIIIVPTYLNRFKNKFVAPPKLRLKWLKELFNNEKKVFVSDFEVNQKQKTATITTVKNFLKSYDKLYVVIGADNLKALHKWQDIEELKKLATFIVATRDNININDSFIKLVVDVDISSTSLRENISKKYLPDKIANKIERFYSMQKRLETITNILDKNKAENIEVFDLAGKDYIVDYAIIATALNNKHTFALLDYLKKELKPNGENFLGIDESEDWIVIDLGDILIHIMTPEYRTKYDIESFLADIGKSSN